MEFIFLPWVEDGRTNDVDKQLQSSRRHQHTALASHRKNRELRSLQRKRLHNIHQSEPNSTSPGSTEQLPRTRNLWDMTRSATLQMSDASTTQDNTPPPPSPRTLLDTTRWGSLNLFGQLELSAEVQKIFDDALIHQWPAFALATHDAAITEIRVTAIRTSLLAPHCLFATIYAGECYRSYFDGTTPHNEMLQLQSKQEALKHLRRAIEDNEGVASDEVLWTITLLAIHGSVRTRKQPRFAAPLYRDNEFYSSLEFERAHLHALRTLVNQKGGLKNLTLHGLSNMISMVDTFHSLRTLTKPVFPPFYPASYLVASLRETWDDVVESRFATYQDGFVFLDALRGGPRLHHIIRQVRVLLETFSLCLRDSRRSPDFMLMVHARRAIQHEALRLRSEGDCLLEVARLSFIIFVRKLAEFAWTLPIIGDFHERVTKLLLQALEECALCQHWQTHHEFLLWATIVGGLAARQSPRVSSFALKLRDSSMAIDKDSWPYVKSVSQKFLPLEYDLGDLCHNFWDEACDFLMEKPVDEQGSSKQQLLRISLQHKAGTLAIGITLEVKHFAEARQPHVWLRIGKEEGLELRRRPITGSGSRMPGRGSGYKIDWHSERDLFKRGANDGPLGNRLLSRVVKEAEAVSDSSTPSHHRETSQLRRTESINQTAPGKEVVPGPSPRIHALELSHSTLSVVSPRLMQQSLYGVPTDHYFLCWPAWAIYSALGQHGLMQGTVCEGSHQEVKSPPEYLTLPESLRPSPLQLAVPHRRWIDRFPFPRLRDNMILLGGLIDLDDFVRDLFGMASLILRHEVRRATWDPESWAIGREFSAKWGYLFQ
ncbi:hypothetical protein Z517_04679 [Fonsecaea pedrosoi CBS 271.37]|uniref:Uncharacterized protein n=1 Tax=Fonsecaea pedrosoi CBS 271.37 TaxID=1442368 RepID=A0A0D2GL50_9EURO|nr:uncharacterized protein Z517_04679 [Fonsecaea pedrosoi CBS 271.37]KIW81653.1 hypothetical protein Z517_04679 [Fonsecaea pedrosoi CBS 271.37]